MKEIKLSAVSSYVFFMKESMCISSAKLSVEISYEKQNILNISEKVMSALLLKKAKELNIDISNSIIILSDEYYQNRSSVKAHIKKENSSEHSENKRKSIFSTDNYNENRVSMLTEFMHQGQFFNDYSSLPLLQNYRVLFSQVLHILFQGVHQTSSHLLVFSSIIPSFV